MGLPRKVIITHTLFQENPQQFVTMSASVSNLTNKVTLGVIAKVTDGLCITIHSTYWMVNCTGKMLRYQVCADAAPSQSYCHKTAPSQSYSPTLSLI